MKLVLGSVQFGLQYGVNSAGRPSNENIAEILLQASANGIQMIDTSAAYGNSELVLGEQMSKICAEFKVISKYPRSERSLDQVLSKSLEDLKREKIYGYLLHHFDVYKDTPSIWNEFQKVRMEGKVEKIGFSLYHPHELELILKRGDIPDIVQIPYNLFDRQFESYFGELKKNGIEIHIRSVFLQGLFFMDSESLPVRLQPLKPYLNELKKYAIDRKLSVAQVALNFTLQNKYIDGVLIGVDNEMQLKENVKSICNHKIDFEIDIHEKELLSPINWN
jgi:aryl-alcohol dehydrogenase-like predicted oxidoreductase